MKRNNIYDMAFFSVPRGPVEIDQDKVAPHPWEFAPLVYVLEASGHPVTGAHPTRGSQSEARLREAGERWLGG